MSDAADDVEQVSLVIGFDHHAPLPEILDADIPWHRFAIVMHPTLRDLPLDAAFYEQLITCCANVLYYDQLQFEFADQVVDTLERAMDIVLYADDEPTPPDRIVFKRGSYVVAVLETEWWVLAGGPTLYHDSYTFSLYSQRPHQESLTDAVRKLCSARGIAIAHQVTCECTTVIPRQYR